jgi:leucine-rich repeat protein SHOC2
MVVNSMLITPTPKSYPNKHFSLQDWPKYDSNYSFQDIIKIHIMDTEIPAMNMDIGQPIKSYIPAHISEFTNLSEVCLYVENIIIPEAINKLNITKLNIYGNYPYQIHHFQNLRELNIKRSSCMEKFPMIVPSFDGLNMLGNLVKLEIEGWKFDNIPYVLCTIPKLQYLKIIGSNISSVPDHISNLTELIYLDISSQSLVYISGEINKLTKLKELKISGPVQNTIDSLTLPQLQKIDLSVFKTDLIANIFSLPELVEFKGWGLTIKRFGKKICLPKIKQINLFNSYMDIFSSEDQYPMLEALIINHGYDKYHLVNKLYEILPDNYSLPMLKTLIIRSNYLNKFPSDLNVPMLSCVDLTNNELEDIKIFAPQLHNLNLKRNNLTDISGINAPLLQHLNVSCNKITKLFDFKFCPNLQSLECEYNKIVELPDSFYELKNLHTLYLTHNPYIIIKDTISKMQSINYLRIDCKKRKYVTDSHMLLASSYDLTDYAIGEEITHLTMFGKYDGQDYTYSYDEPIWYKIVDSGIQSEFLNHLPYELKYLKITGLEVKLENLPILLETMVLVDAYIDIETNKIPFGVKLIME